MDFLSDWQDAPALVLSCPGPMRRHEAALLAAGKLALPQVFLGGESQLLALAAAMPRIARRLFFAPLPEMFSADVSLQAAWRAAGEKPHATKDVVHLRFGSIRDSRVLKGARNAAVIAETETAPPITTSHHPFASGRLLPAAMRRVYTCVPHAVRPAPILGEALPAISLPASCLTADLDEAATRKPARRGLDLVRLAEYDAAAWATGLLGTPASLPAAAKETVLLPWNLAHYGSILPEFLRRLALFRRPDTPIPTVLIMPFNDPGMTGAIPRLIQTLRDAADHPDATLKTMFLARVTDLRGLARLKTISRTVWVDGNDPECSWTLARFTAAGFAPIRLPADQAIRIQTETRFGDLAFDTQLPAPRRP